MEKMRDKEVREVFLYTDGGANVHTNKNGAWAFVVVENDELIHEQWGVESETTNSKMEILALKHALIYAIMMDKTVKIVIRSDSDYCVKSYNEWSINWKKNNWRKSNKKPVEHQNEWQVIDQLRSDNITVEWIKAHNGDRWNEYTDKLCTTYK